MMSKIARAWAFQREHNLFFPSFIPTQQNCLQVIVIVLDLLLVGARLGLTVTRPSGAGDHFQVSLFLSPISVVEFTLKQKLPAEKSQTFSIAQ